MQERLWTGEKVAIPATVVEQNDYQFYSATIPGKALLASCFVSRRLENERGGFNRSLSTARARDIARYLERGNSIPTNIILSAQSGSGIAFDGETLAWDPSGRNFLVLDGQHRLFSMDYTDKDYDFVVAIYDNLSPQDEVQLFIDINTNQKGVPPALLLDIKHLAGTETDIETQLRSLFDAVANEKRSPLYGRMSPSSTRSGYISRVTFNSALKKRLEAGPLAGLRSSEDQAKLLNNYLIAADRVITASGATNNKLNKSTVLQAFFEIFDDVVGMTLEKHSSLKPDDLSDVMSPLSRIEFDAYIGSNRPSKGKLVTDMRAALLPSASVTSDML